MDPMSLIAGLTVGAASGAIAIGLAMASKSADRIIALNTELARTKLELETLDAEHKRWTDRDAQGRFTSPEKRAAELAKVTA